MNKIIQTIVYRRRGKLDAIAGLVAGIGLAIGAIATIAATWVSICALGAFAMFIIFFMG